MKLNKKSLLVACVLAAMSTSAFAASTTTSTSTTTVTNTDTPTSTSTRVTREQHSTPHLLLRGNRRKLIELHRQVLA